MRRVLVTGARGPLTARQETFIGSFLSAEFAHDPQDWVLVHGECIFGGVDLVADKWGRDRPGRVTVEAHPASGFSSPTMRNTHMVRLGADVCLALPKIGSRGTWDCARKAADAGIPVILRTLPLAVTR